MKVCAALIRYCLCLCAAPHGLPHQIASPVPYQISSRVSLQHNAPLLQTCTQVLSLLLHNYTVAVVQELEDGQLFWPSPH